MSPQLMMVLAGCAVGAGLYLLARQLLPSTPGLGKALERLNTAPTPVVALPAGAPLEQRVGARLQPLLGRQARRLTLVSDPDLAILGRSRSTLLGEKVIAAAVGILIGPVVGLLLTLGGVGTGYLLPGAASLLLGALAWVFPDLHAREQASKARYEWVAATSAFMDLVAIARVSGDAANEAMVRSARLSGNATFRRISETLQHASWSGQAPWEALAELQEQLAVPELGDVADIMRLTGAGGQVIDTLRQRARSLREAQLAAEHAEAAKQSERLTAAMTLTAVVFLLLLLYPAAVSMLA